jgi:hypothetical protein
MASLLERVPLWKVLALACRPFLLVPPQRVKGIMEIDLNM